MILNLPREERFKLENVILASVIPGPNEPTGIINTFLSPIVSDLSRLYEGIMIRTPTLCISFTPLRAILVCIMCDLPASRKVCGFTNFNGLKACSKFQGIYDCGK